jgi:hypothetical protein
MNQKYISMASFPLQRQHTRFLHYFNSNQIPTEYYLKTFSYLGQAWLLKPVILPTWEAEIRKIVFWGQPRQKDPISTSDWIWLPVIQATRGNEEEDHHPGWPRHEAKFYLWNNKRKKGLVAWLKGKNTYLASARIWVQAPVQKKKIKKVFLFWGQLCTIVWSIKEWLL